MAGLKIKLDGLQDLEIKISRWEVKKMAAMRALVKKTANNIRRNARRRAPVRTGELRKSIQVKYSPNKLAAFVRAIAPYSHIVEYGSASKGISPRPFFAPAYEGQRAKYEAQLKKILGEV